MILKATWNWFFWGKSSPQVLFCFSSLFMIDMADISWCLGQVTSVIHSSHLLAAFRSHESPSKRPCLVVTTLHKALWHIKFSSLKWKSHYIHRESHLLALWNWNFPFSSIPTTNGSHRGQGKSTEIVAAQTLLWLSLPNLASKKEALPRYQVYIIFNFTSACHIQRGDS